MIEIAVVVICAACVSFTIGYAITWFADGGASRRDAKRRNKQLKQAREATWGKPARWRRW